MKHYIITGGAGFIGSNLIRRLYQQEPDVTITCIDNFDPFYSADLKQFNIRDFKTRPDFHFLYLDIAAASPEELCEAIPDPVDVIVHLAGKGGVRRSIQYPSDFLHTNITGLHHMLEVARLKGVSQFVFASSSSVYGINDHFPWKEEGQLMPVSPYAMSKLSGEMLGHVYSKLYGIRFPALRFFTVYGPAQRPDLAIFKFTKALLNDEPVTLYGDGHTSRDYTFIDDAVQGIIAAMQYDKTGFEIINIGNNYSISLMELVGSLEELTGKKAIIELMPEQAGDVPKTVADISKARRLLGYEPDTPFKEGLKIFYDWFVTNEELLLQATAH